ncbi:hypothetical protein EFP84_14620 [Leptospira kmetyi]|uniref:Uncharacterized protein n=1 Tax=Leptospira kmetyi TaxID=408139 RepID=A0AAD0XQ94_9LEPT|nr:hypothetical protein EFP84_14620 [Leptospira kmetyi]
MYKIEPNRQAIIVKIIPNSERKRRFFFENSSKNRFRKSGNLPPPGSISCGGSHFLIDRIVY